MRSDSNVPRRPTFLTVFMNVLGPFLLCQRSFKCLETKAKNTKHSGSANGQKRCTMLYMNDNGPKRFTKSSSWFVLSKLKESLQTYRSNVLLNIRTCREISQIVKKRKTNYSLKLDVPYCV